MSSPEERLATALSDRYKIERELGQGGTGPQIFAETSRYPQMRSRE